MKLTERIRNLFKAKIAPKDHYGKIDIRSNDWTSILTPPWTMFVISTLVLVVFSYVAIAVLGSQDYLEGVIARMLAGYCQITGQCNLNVILPAFAVANIILIDLVIFVLFSLVGPTDPNSLANIDIPEMVDDLGDQLAERLEDIRQQLDPTKDELVAALDAIYHLSKEFQEEEDNLTLCKVRDIAGETLGFIKTDSVRDTVKEPAGV